MAQDWLAIVQHGTVDKLEWCIMNGFNVDQACGGCRTAVLWLAYEFCGLVTREKEFSTAEYDILPKIRLLLQHGALVEARMPCHELDGTTNHKPALDVLRWIRQDETSTIGCELYDRVIHLFTAQ